MAKFFELSLGSGGRKNIEHVVWRWTKSFRVKLIILAFIWHFQLWGEIWAVRLSRLVITEKGSTRAMFGDVWLRIYNFRRFVNKSGALTAIRFLSGKSRHGIPPASETANKGCEVWNTIQFELFQLNLCRIREISFNCVKVDKHHQFACKICGTTRDLREILLKITKMRGFGKHHRAERKICQTSPSCEKFVELTK